MPPSPIEAYLKSIKQIYSTGGGTDEESYYAPLETLINEIGGSREFKPKVRAVAQLRNTGAGEPDFGLFTANQFQRSSDDEPLPGQTPERGVIEAKGWAENLDRILKSEQIEKYLNGYGMVLATNYWDFRLIARTPDGMNVERCRLCADADEFHDGVEHFRKTANEKGPRLIEFLRRALLHDAPLSSPEDLAWFLASYARDARHRVEETAALPALGGLRKALEEALGMTFEGENHALSDILHSWKSYSANRANKALERKGAFWQPESYDHLIRDEQDYGHSVGYVLENPKEAGLHDWKWVGGGGSKSGMAFQAMNQEEKTNHGQDVHAASSRAMNHGQDARATSARGAFDIYLNDIAYWENVPREVWDYTIGGYQVIKKWLSYREKSMLGRGLKLEEAEYVTEMVRRIAALILLQPDLDANYEKIKSDTWPWPGN